MPTITVVLVFIFIKHVLGTDPVVAPEPIRIHRLPAMGAYGWVQRAREVYFMSFLSAFVIVIALRWVVVNVVCPSGLFLFCLQFSARWAKLRGRERGEVGGIDGGEGEEREGSGGVRQGTFSRVSQRPFQRL